MLGYDKGTLLGKALKDRSENCRLPNQKPTKLELVQNARRIFADAQKDLRG
jgi:hypothetical protein